MQPVRLEARQILHVSGSANDDRIERALLQPVEQAPLSLLAEVWIEHWSKVYPSSNQTQNRSDSVLPNPLLRCETIVSATLVTRPAPRDSSHLSRCFLSFSLLFG